MWGPVALVVAGVLAPALVEFLDFPLRSQLWLLILAVHPFGYLVALGFVAAAIVAAHHLGTGARRVARRADQCDGADRPDRGRPGPPWWLDELARPGAEVSSIGGRVVVTAIVSESNGLSRGYMYAPWTRRGQVIDLGHRLRPDFPLGSGWWWVESG